MRPVFPAALLLALFPACGAASTRGPNPADKPGGVTNMQPGSGGTYNDVIRSEGAEPRKQHPRQGVDRTGHVLVVERRIESKDVRVQLRIGNAVHRPRAPAGSNSPR